jgi:hypothetical protein
MTCGTRHKELKALATMKIPGHEAAVEVPAGREVTPNATAHP